MIRVEVTEGYPCQIRLISDGAEVGIQINHTNLLDFEHALVEARRQVLMKLPRDRWHEVDPRLAQVQP